MSRRKKDPLRELTGTERRGLDQISRSQTAPAAEVARAEILLAVARGDDYQTAARSVGRRSGDAVSHLVARFNAEGSAALAPRHGGGRRATYGPEARGRIVAEAARAPTPEADGTAIWSLSTLRGSLRAASDGLPAVSTDTIRRVLHESGSSYRRTRTWCPTGPALRRRKAGPAAVTDPDADSKKVDRGGLPHRRGDGAGGLVYRPGRALPDDPLSRPVVAPPGRSGTPTARVPPRGHGQGPDAVPPGRRPRPRRGRKNLPQLGPAPGRLRHDG